MKIKFGSQIIGLKPYDNAKRISFIFLNFPMNWVNKWHSTPLDERSFIVLVSAVTNK